MGYSRDVYEEAMAELERRRSRARQKAAALREKMIAKYPRILEIEREMSNTAYKMARAVLDGGDVESAVEKSKAGACPIRRSSRRYSQKRGFAPRISSLHTPAPPARIPELWGNRFCECMKSLLRELAFSCISSYSGAAKEMCFDSLRLDYYPGRPDSKTGIVPKPG